MAVRLVTVIVIGTHNLPGNLDKATTTVTVIGSHNPAGNLDKATTMVSVKWKAKTCNYCWQFLTLLPK